MALSRTVKGRPDVSKQLFDALRCCGLDQPFRSKVIDYDHFFHCCHRHGITGSLFENLQKHGTDDPVLLSRAKEQYRNQFFTYAGYRDFLDRLHTRLTAAGIKVALLKGASLWFTCYTNPMLRHVSDVDILIRAQDLDRIEPELAAMGYQADSERKLFRDGSGRIIDVHCGNLGLAEESSGIGSDDLLASASPLPGYPSFLTAAPSLETRYLAFHAMKHSFLRFSWLRDVYLSQLRHKDSPLESKPIDWALYLHNLLTGPESQQKFRLNALERYLARRMLRVDQHPLGQILLAWYQPTWSASLRCLVRGTRGKIATRESLSCRVRRLLRETSGIFT